MARVGSGFGSDGQWMTSVAVGGGNDKIGGVLDAWTFETDGYRDHSAARRRQLNAKVVAEPVTAPASPCCSTPSTSRRRRTRSALPAPRPMPTRARRVALATQFNTGKTVRQNQGGVQVEQRLSERDNLEFRLYGGTRQLTQYLGFSGIAPSSAGGIVDIDRSYGGGAFSWHHNTTLNGLPLLAAPASMPMACATRATGFVNQNGTQGALRRDETDKAGSLGAFAQFDWTWNPAWRLVGGVRASKVRLRIDDHYITAASPDDSGTATYNNVSPVLGVVWQALDRSTSMPTWAAASETPTLTEVAYGPRRAGTNLGLQPSTSRQGEIGVKWQGQGQRLEAALFDADSHDEISADVQRQRPLRLPERQRRASARAGTGMAQRPTDRASAMAPGWLTPGSDAYFGDAFRNAQGATRGLRQPPARHRPPQPVRREQRTSRWPVSRWCGDARGRARLRRRPQHAIRARLHAIHQPACRLQLPRGAHALVRVRADRTILPTGVTSVR
ncbi:TonB-dependent receptor domain-containing protein [Cupriavidus basilensis]